LAWENNGANFVKTMVAGKAVIEEKVRILASTFLEQRELCYSLGLG
jgi:hypothetical protein